MVELYPIPPVAEREVRLILLLNVFQSVLESAPLVVAEARERESSCPERVRPFAMPRVRGECASEESHATVPERAFTSEITPARLPEREDITLCIPTTVPEREVSSEVRENIFVVRVETFPERETIVVLTRSTAPEREDNCAE